MGRGQSAAAYTDAWVQENQHRYNIFAYDQPSQGLSDPQREGDAPRYGDIESFAHYPQQLINVTAATAQAENIRILMSNIKTPLFRFSRSCLGGKHSKCDN